MSQGFDTLVRPSVLPNIRPPARPRLRPSIPPAVRALSTADPTSGQAVIMAGSSPQVIELTASGSNSWSKSNQRETQRTVTTQRVYQKEPDGKVNKDNYIDVDHTTEMKTKNSDGTETKYTYANPPEANNIENIEVGTIYVNEGVASSTPPGDGGSGAP